MIIAREKRASNIAEYILYLWQIEDLLRAMDFDLEKVSQKLVNQYEANPDLKLEIFDWYAGLIQSMKEENLIKSGHLQYLEALVEELNDFHFRLIDSPHHADYQKKYWDAVYNISDFRKVMPVREKIGDVEVALTVLYGLLLMRMKKKTVSHDTLEAIESIRDLVALLSDKYRDYEEGRLEV